MGIQGQCVAWCVDFGRLLNYCSSWTSVSYVTLQANLQKASCNIKFWLTKSADHVSLYVSVKDTHEGFAVDLMYQSSHTTAAALGTHNLHACSKGTCLSLSLLQASWNCCPSHQLLITAADTSCTFCYSSFSCQSCILWPAAWLANFSRLCCILSCLHPPYPSQSMKTWSPSGTVRCI